MPQKAEYTKDLLPKVEDLLPKDLYKNDYSRFIHDGPKLETIQIPIHSRLDK